MSYQPRHAIEKLRAMSRRARIVVLFGSVSVFAVAGGALATVAQAGSPHFVGTPVFTTSGSTITVTAKEAGLGNEPQIHVVLTAAATCLNNGGNNPQAANKTTVTAQADEPVQNGKADYSLSGTAVFDPAASGACSSVTWSDVSLTDTTNNLTAVPVAG